MQALFTFLRNLGAARLMILSAVLAGVIAFFAWIIGEISQTDYRLLYGDLDLADSAKVVGQLEKSGIPYRIEGGGTAVFVPSSQVERMRVALAEQGLPGGASLGYEVFDSTSTLGTTNFVQNVNLVRALEGELSRTIRSIQTVKGARIHLVLPKRELFSRERQQPSASVLLQMNGNARLTAAQVVAVQHLIASAVPGLNPDRISLVDGRGTLLSGALDDSQSVDALSEKADERRLRLESQLARTIEQLLEKTVGPGKIRAEVFADMDFDRINTSEEVYDPDGQVVRSTQSVSEGSKSTENGGEPPVSVAGNLPDSESGVNGQGSNSASDNRSEETVNYEISKKVTNHVREAGIINRLSVAVLVDGRYTPDANGALVYQPRPPEELERLNSLVRGVIGFNQKRGDTVEIVNLQFAEPDPEPDEGFPFPFGLEKNDLFRIAEYMVLSLLSLLVLLLVIRPMVARLLEALPRTPVASLAPSLMGAGNGQVALAAPGAAAPGSSGGAPQLPSSASGAVPTGVPTVGSAALPPSGGLTPEEMIIVDRVEGRVKASSVRKIGEFIEKHPDESLAIIRHWLHTEE